jgi:hypothetical protein
MAYPIPVRRPQPVINAVLFFMSGNTGSFSFRNRFIGLWQCPEMPKTPIEEPRGKLWG